jgi:two-component system sensor histidine kinase YesM
VNLQSLKSGDYKISDIIVALTKIFRYSTGSLDARVTLENELEHVRNYMMIQGYRFEGKYDFEFDIAPETLSCEILRLTLQPIVENAILHGLSEYSENCKIVVKAYISDGYLYIKITDNGVGISAADLERLMYNIKNGEGESIGLKNVYKRLKLVWDDEADLNIESKLMKGTTVTIKIKAQSLSKDI